MSSSWPQLPVSKTTNGTLSAPVDSSDRVHHKACTHHLEHSSLCLFHLHHFRHQLCNLFLSNCPYHRHCCRSHLPLIRPGLDLDLVCQCQTHCKHSVNCSLEGQQLFSDLNVCCTVIHHQLHRLSEALWHHPEQTLEKTEIFLFCAFSSPATE